MLSNVEVDIHIINIGSSLFVMSNQIERCTIAKASYVDRYFISSQLQVVSVRTFVVARMDE